MAPDKDFTFANVPSSSLVGFDLKPASRRTRYQVHSHALFQRFPGQLAETRKKAQLGEYLSLHFFGTKSQFEAFFQYVYTGTYDSPEPVLVSPDVASSHDSEPPTPVPVMDSDEDSDPTAAEYRKSHKRQSDLLMESFKVELARLKNRVSATAHYSRPNMNPLESYENIFKWHVDIYLMSQIKFPSLAELATYKLHQSLVDFQLHDERAIDIVKLLEYVCDMTNIIYQKRPIAQIIIHYAAIHIDKLWKNEDFIMFLRRNGSFMVDLMNVLINYGLPETRLMWEEETETDVV